MLGFVFSYFIWHYSTSLKELFGICRDFLWFVYHFFSIDVLSKTLFSPWQRMDEQYQRGAGMSAFFESFIVTTLMRIVGFLIRSFVIIIGFMMLALVFAIEIVFFFCWMLMPLIILLLFVSGVRLLFIQ